MNCDVRCPDIVHVAVFGRCRFVPPPRHQFLQSNTPTTAQTNRTPITIKVVVTTEGPLTGEQNSSITFHDFPCNSLGDAQCNVSLCFKLRHTSSNTEQSQFHEFPVRSIRAIVWFNHSIDVTSSVVRRS